MCTYIIIIEPAIRNYKNDRKRMASSAFKNVQYILGCSNNMNVRYDDIYYEV